MLAAASARLLSTAPGTVFIHPDHLGSTTLVTGSAGSIQGTRRFEPEGAISAEEGTLDVYGFTGQETDLGTELLHFKSRTLDLVSGRWLSSDPLFGVSSTEHFSKLGEFSNLYAYVAGRMINSYDSTGLAGSLTVFVQENRAGHGSKTEKGMRQAGLDVRPVPRKGSPRNRQIKTAAFIGHTSYNDGDRTQRFALPDKKTGKFDQVSPEVAAMRVMQTFPKIETVVIMGCHASAQDQKGGSFIERMAAKFAEQGKVGVKVIGAAGVAAFSGNYGTAMSVKSDTQSVYKKGLHQAVSGGGGQESIAKENRYKTTGGAYGKKQPKSGGKKVNKKSK